MNNCLSKLQRIKFWHRNGFSLIESIYMLSAPLSRHVIVGLKKLRIENIRRKSHGGAMGNKEESVLEMLSISFVFVVLIILLLLFLGF